MQDVSCLYRDVRQPKYLIFCPNIFMVLSLLNTLWTIQELTWTSSSIRLISILRILLWYLKDEMYEQKPHSCRHRPLYLYYMSIHFDWDIVTRMSNFSFEIMMYYCCKRWLYWMTWRLYCYLVLQLPKTTSVRN